MRDITRLLVLCTCLLAVAALRAQTAPAIGGSYYIAAQTWDGSKYVERFLNLQGNYIYQTTDIAQASVWDAVSPAKGGGIALRCNSKYIMRGGITSTSWGCSISDAAVGPEDLPEGSKTIKSNVSGYAYYVISPNDGSGFTAVNAPNEASFQPKTSLYTPYFKFYEAGTPVVSVVQALADGAAVATGATFVFTPAGSQQPVSGNMWPLESGTITVAPGSYSEQYYTFVGFRVGDSADTVPSVDTSALTGNTTVTAVFTVNDAEALQAETERQQARKELLKALGNVAVGTQVGYVTQDAYDLAMATYENTTLSAADYQNAVTLLYASCCLPGVGTKWRIINNANANQVICVGLNNALLHSRNLASLYQMWEVVGINPEEPTQLAMRNLGSGTYLYTVTQSSNSPTITTTDPVYVGLVASSPGVFMLQTIGKTPPNIYYTTSSYGPAIITGTSGYWRLQEVPEVDVDNLSAAETDRRAARQELLDLIGDARALSTELGAIGYYSTLGTAIAAATTTHADATRLITDYTSATAALRDAIAAAPLTSPEAESLYIICDRDGRNAMQHEGRGATMSVYDDTDLDHFWHLSYAGTESEGVLPWQQRYTLTSIEGENTVLSLLVTLLGDDQYTMEIEGDSEWNTAYAHTPLSIHRATVGTDAGYLADGQIYRIRNASSGRMLARSSEWPARVAVADADDTLTDWNQLWRVEKQQGADRYTLHNVESSRNIEEQLTVGAQIAAAFTPGVWHVEPADGGFRLMTTMAPQTQMAIGFDGDKAVAVAQDAQGNVWKFEKATPAQAPTVYHQVYRILNRYVTESPAATDDYMYADNTHASHSYAARTPLTDDHMKWLLVERDSLNSDGSPATDAQGAPIRLVALRNVYTALYINPPKAMGAEPYFFQMVDYTADNGKAYTLFMDPANGQYLTPRTNQDELIHYPTISHQYPHWTIVEVAGETLCEADLMDKTDQVYGYTAPADGAVMRVYSASSTCLDEYYKTSILQHKGEDPKRYSQLWRLHYNPLTGLYRFENIYTGHYMANATAAGATIATTADADQAGEFAIARNKSVTTGRYYNILDARLGTPLNCQSTNIAPVAVAKSAAPGVTDWRFTLDTRTDAEYTAMRQKYDELNNMVGNADKYNSVLATIFTDNACTTLRTDITEADIEEAMDQLPDMLADMVEKIRDDSWEVAPSGNCWEKTFRIQDYRVTSNSNYMSGQTYVGYSYSQLNEPTGILAHPGDILAVMVDRLPQADASLKVEMVEGLNRTGTQVALKKGLNLIQVSEDCNVFIYYQIGGVADEARYYISNFPDIRIHIEGGEVYGCIDRTRPMASTREKANAMWADMLSDGLILNGPMAQIKGEAIMLNFNSKSVVQGCPERIGEVIDIWDFIIKKEQWIMGLRDREGNIINDYIPHLKERWNNRWLAYERTGGYMNANGGGAQYNTGTIAAITNFESLSQGGGHWGPAHEHGHDHQPLINMCGMTEVSNNLFSNVANYEFGAIVSRGSSLPDAGNVYANGGHWFDNNIWTMTQMYYKLFLYYHIAGNKPTFYPEVFARLNKDRLLHNASVAVPADRDYLQFALVCSEVAGEDLSEFFEAYGMLRPIGPEYSTAGESAFEEYKGQPNCRIVGDYSTYHVYTTPEMIAQAKERMAACGPRNGSIMFIDDRVRQEPAAHEWRKEGQMRGNRGDGGVVGAYGDVGMWSDFTAQGKKVYARDYTLTREWSPKGLTLHISGEGAVGYKLYDTEGNLVYFSAFSDMLLPARVTETYDVSDLVLVVAQADGTSVELACADDQLYTQTTYRDGSPEGISMPVTGRFEPELRANDVAVIEPVASASTDGYAYRATDNVVMKDADGQHRAASIVIADKAGMYLPAEVETSYTTYSRANTAGWNSVCLPFAVTDADFGEGSAIYSIGGMLHDDGAYVLTLRRKYAAEAGEPCFVWCPEHITEWAIEVDDALLSTDVKAARSADGAVVTNGSFANKLIGQGRYKLNGDGTAFGITTDAGTITAFRSYIEASADHPQKIRVRMVEDTDGIDSVVYDRELQPGIVYDLSGRVIPAPVKGQPYILDGRVYISR